MTSGYARGEAPGARWAYNDNAISLYAQTLERVFQTDLNSAVLQRLAPLQFQDGALFGSRSGLGMVASIRDFARIGWFWLNRGNWAGVQVLPASFFDNFLKPGVAGSVPRSSAAGSDYLGVGSFGGDSDQTGFGPGIYGFNWWFNSPVGTTSTLAWPHAPPDTYQANGHWGGEVVIVIPSLQIVVAAVGNWGDESNFTPGSASTKMNMALKLIEEADVGGGGGPLQPSAPSNLSAQ
jgi:CubicO group peptidase (beta-lactamase class C family)